MSHLRSLLSTFATFACGCAACVWLHAHGVPTIVAAAALGLAVTVSPVDHRTFWTGVFVGMSSAEILGGVAHVLAVSAIGAVYHALARPYLDGVGGKMGAVAFLTTATWLGGTTWLC